MAEAETKVITVEDGKGHKITTPGISTGRGGSSGSSGGGNSGGGNNGGTKNP